MLEQTKFTPCATLFSETMRKNSAPTAIVCASAVKPPRKNSGYHCAGIVKPTITAVTNSRTVLNVLLDTLAVAGAKILSGDGAGRQGNRYPRHMNDAKQARADAKAGLGRRAKMPERLIDHRHVDEDDGENN